MPDDETNPLITITFSDLIGAPIIDVLGVKQIIPTQALDPTVGMSIAEPPQDAGDEAGEEGPHQGRASE